MVDAMIDIYHSRRAMYNKCKYWKRDESKKSILEYNTEPSGFFYAKPDRSIQKQENQVSNVFHFDKTVFTLKTNDEVEDLTHGDIVEYRGEKYLVEEVSLGIHIKETEFSTQQHATTYIYLRR